jgi:hypothetical protein
LILTDIKKNLYKFDVQFEKPLVRGRLLDANVQFTAALGATLVPIKLGGYQILCYTLHHTIDVCGQVFIEINTGVPRQ